MKEALIDVCKKHNIDVKRINMDQEVSDIIDDIENKLIHKEIKVTNPRIAMAELWKVGQNIDDKNLLKNIDLKSELDYILEDKSYTFDGRFIVCKKFIPCSIIRVFGKSVLLNDKQKSKLISLGYGIRSYRLRFSKTFTEVYCEGKHPNLNSNSKQYCLDHEFLDLPLSKENINLMEELLSHFNMLDCFISRTEINKIKEVIQ